MAAGRESAAVREWLSTVLGADVPLLALATGGVFNGSRAPQGTPYPLVLYFFMSGIDYATVGAYRIWTNMIWTVKAIADAGGYDTLDPIAARIDELLQRASGTAASGTIWSADRQKTIEYEGLVAGHEYRHLGATYRVYAS